MIARLRPRQLALVALCAAVAGGCGGAGSQHRSPAHVELLAGNTPANESAGAPPGYRPRGRLVADNGFRPERDGFSFENYGSPSGVAELGAAQVQELFGSRVCAEGTRSTCQLSPPAQAWLDMENDALASGHCFGLAVISTAFFARALNPSAFGASPAARLSLAGNVALQRAIAQANALQGLSAVRSRARAGTPNQVLDALIADLRRGQAPTLGLFRPEGAGGHAVTPYAVEDRGDGRFAALVYDNNYPRITRAISFDRRADAWKFVARANPRDPQQIYSGDARAANLLLYPAPRLRGLACEFCRPTTPGSGSNGPAQVNEIALEGDPANHAHLLIADAHGHHTGFQGRRLVNQIPGARIVRRVSNRDWLENPEPAYVIPAGVAVTITLDGGLLRRPSIARLTLVGPGDDLSVGAINVAPGRRVTIGFAGRGAGLSFRGDSRLPESPVFDLGVSAAGASYAFSVKASALAGGATIRMALDQPGRALQIDTRDARRPTRYELRFSREEAQVVRRFSHPGLVLAAGETARLDYGRFTRQTASLALEVRRAGRLRVERLSG